jgi:Asp-tRNA(Asn)/Glu-tRNA(Gln) amidotransferase A subunit family amidase
MELYRLKLREAAEAIRTGRSSSEELVLSCLARIRTLEAQVQAWAWLDETHAIARAQEADRARASSPGGPIHGVPLGVKDIFATRGIPTEMGSPIMRGNVPERSAVVVDRLVQSGGILLGKTVTTEFAHMTPGKTRNPWNPEHTPGGSSSGSAAAVAAGFVPGAIGTQTNGSVIRPAAYCGVVGFKPSQGLLPNDGVNPFAPNLDQIGVFARCVDDAVLLASCMQPEGTPLIPTEVAALTRPPRLARVRSPIWERAEPAQQERFLRDAETLAAAGARVEDKDLLPHFRDAYDVHRVIMAYEAMQVFAKLQPEQREHLSPGLRRYLEDAGRIRFQTYQDALDLRPALRKQLELLLQGFDAIITPPVTGEAPAGLEKTGDPSFCTLWTLAGLPALTLPSGRGPHGLPLGLQLVGSYQGDVHLLAVAGWCEAELGFTLGEPSSSIPR